MIPAQWQQLELDVSQHLHKDGGHGWCWLCLVQHSEGGQSSGRQQEVMRHLHTNMRNVVKQVKISWSRARPTLAAAWWQWKISFLSHLYCLWGPPMMILWLHNIFRKELKNFWSNVVKVHLCSNIKSSTLSMTRWLSNKGVFWRSVTNDFLYNNQLLWPLTWPEHLVQKRKKNSCSVSDLHNQKRHNGRARLHTSDHHRHDKLYPGDC